MWDAGVPEVLHHQAPVSEGVDEVPHVDLPYLIHLLPLVVCARPTFPMTNKQVVAVLRTYKPETHKAFILYFVFSNYKTYVSSSMISTALIQFGL